MKGLLSTRIIKGGKANLEFYNKFSNFLSSKSDLGWDDVYHIKDVIPTGISGVNKTASNKIREFFSDNYIKYILGVTEHYENRCELYYDMLKFIDDNKDAIEFFYMNEHTKSEDYLIYLFEAEKIKVALWGYKKIVDKERATITFQYI